MLVTMGHSSPKTPVTPTERAPLQVGHCQHFVERPRSTGDWGIWGKWGSPRTGAATKPRSDIPTPHNDRRGASSPQRGRGPLPTSPPPRRLRRSSPTTAPASPARARRGQRRGRARGSLRGAFAGNARAAFRAHLSLAAKGRAPCGKGRPGPTTHLRRALRPARPPRPRPDERPQPRRRANLEVDARPPPDRHALGRDPPLRGDGGRDRARSARCPRPGAARGRRARRRRLPHRWR